MTRADRGQLNGPKGCTVTVLRERAHRRAYRSSARRRRALAAWLRYYNERRAHSALNYRPPIPRPQEAAA